MKKLIPMTDFVLEQYEKQTNPTIFEETVHNYANFLKQPLKLEMFVPCDEDGNVLEMPVNYDVWLELHNKNVDGEKGTIGFLLHEEYQKAKEKVIFERFNVTHKEIYDKKYLRLTNNIVNIHIYGKIFVDIKSQTYVKTVEDLTSYNLEIKNEILLF